LFDAVSPTMWHLLAATTGNEYLYVSSICTPLHKHYLVIIFGIVLGVVSVVYCTVFSLLELLATNVHHC